MSENKQNFWSAVVRNVDELLVPISFGFLSVLLLVQAVTSIPAVRQTVDRVEGRFVVYPSATAYLNQNQAAGTIKLYVSPDSGQAEAGLSVLVNGASLGQFKNGSVSIHVRNGDKIEIEASNLHQKAYITVDHNNPAILRPAPGRTVELSPGQMQATLPTVQFVK